MPRASKKQQRLKGEGFWDTLTSWGRTIRDYPKLITDGPVSNPAGSISSPGLPDKSILKDIADNSYKSTSDEMKPIAGYTLKLKTPTLVIYQKDGENVMVIGVRGTADFRDFRAWFSTAFNVIPDSQRFKEDVAKIAEFQQKYPVSTYTYYATGHSLGGTLIDELIKKGMVKEARTYNPAIETSDIPDVALSQKNHRIYADGDPLYLLQGRYDNPTEVRKSYKYYPASVMDFVPGYDKYKQHVLANPVFVGGEVPEYDKLKWGSFTKQFQAYLRKNPKSNIKDLKDFAQMVVANPDKFAKTTEKRARFYLNVILKGSGDMKKVVMKPQDYYAEHRNIVGLLDKTGKALQREAKDQKAEATQMAKRLGHANPFFHLKGAGIMANSQFYRTDPKRLGFTGGRKDPNEEPPEDEEGRVYIVEDDEPLPPEEEEEEEEDDPQVRVDREALENYAMVQFDTALMLLNDDGAEGTIRFGPNGEVIPQTEALMRRLYDTYVREDLNDNQLLRAQMLEQIINQIRQSYNNFTNPPPINEGSGKRKGRGFFDDLKEGFKKGVESRIGKIPEPAVLSSEQQADVRRRQHIQDVDKQREKMVASKKQIAIDDMMGYAQHPNALKAIYAREGTDNAKDYLAKVVEKATKTAEKFYPY